MLVNRCQFVDDHQRRHGEKRLRDILGTSRSSFSYWRRTTAARTVRQSVEARLAAQIRKVHQDSDGTYGAPRITAELRDQGEQINHKRVVRIMRTARCNTRRWHSRPDSGPRSPTRTPSKQQQLPWPEPHRRVQNWNTGARFGP
ncbi:IS3 family transposase [Streptomyces brevispora]|uniref:IS3 family transposase n=1 Tax=Streptomyces brevispora TaxID=887462 RepID=UPI0039A4D02D